MESSIAEFLRMWFVSSNYQPAQNSAGSLRADSNAIKLKTSGDASLTGQTDHGVRTKFRMEDCRAGREFP